MSALSKLDLLGPHAHGAACNEAVLKTVAEDFQVDEVLDIPLSSEGEHLWLWVEKRGLNIEETAHRLDRATGVQQRNVSCAGLKDCQALTRQWFGLHLPGKVDPDLDAAEGAGLWILRRARHSHKLRRGVHAANGFTLHLTGLRTERAVPDARLERIAADGVPSYFGLQRFGHGDGNLVNARSCAEQDLLPADRNLRSRFLSAGRSYLLNCLLAERVTEDSWSRAAAGNLLVFINSHNFFLAGEEECRDTRLATLDLHPTRPFWGEDGPPGGAGILDRELAPAGSKPTLYRWLTRAGMAHKRRIPRLPIQRLAWHYSKPDVLQLKFVLPADCFAAVVVCEILDLVPTGQTENPYAY